MCVRHHRVESQRHCGQHAEMMPTMAHVHSAMSHPGVEVGPALVSESCQTSCVTAERLAVSRKVVLKVTSAQSDAIILDTPAKIVAPDSATLSLFDGTPPLPARIASFCILRI